MELTNFIVKNILSACLHICYKKNTDIETKI